MLGQYYTVGNPFEEDLFKEWATPLRQMVWLEPFAGSGNLTHVHDKWELFDIDPKRDDIVKRDTIQDFPTGFDVVVTNPPYLAKNSAKRRGWPYTSPFDDLYKHALDLMLKNAKWVAVIIPESFITSKHLKSRLWAVISLEYPMFNDTTCPVCLALFTPNVSDDFIIQKQGVKLSYKSLPRLKEDPIKMTFNAENGVLGLYACDGNHTRIRFVHGDEIGEVKPSSRSVTRISVETEDLDTLILRCNSILNQWRQDTYDVFLTSFKGLRPDGVYRRRLDWKTARTIVSKALK